MVEGKPFEAAMGELEGVVGRLESGEISLDDSLAEFEKGIKLVRECEAKLSDAKGKIEKLIRDTSGEFKAAPFEPK